MRFFSPKTPAERRTLAFDFSSDLPEGATLASVVALTVAVWRGADAAPDAIKNGAPAIGGADVLQSVEGGLAGVDYLVTARASLSDGQIVELMAVLPVRSTI